MRTDFHDDMDFEEHVQTEICRIQWNLGDGKGYHGPYGFVPMLCLTLFESGSENFFPPLTMLRRLRAAYLKHRDGVENIPRELRAEYEIYHRFYTSVMFNVHSETESICSELRASAIKEWKYLYDYRVEVEYSNCCRHMRAFLYRAPYMEINLRRELDWWTWVLFPERIPNPSEEFKNRFKSDRSFSDIRNAVSSVTKGDVHYEQIGLKKDVGWRVYAITESRLRYWEWLDINVNQNGTEDIDVMIEWKKASTKEQSWSAEKPIPEIGQTAKSLPEEVPVGDSLSNQEPIQQPAFKEEPTKKQKGEREKGNWTLLMAAYYLSFKNVKLNDPRTCHRKVANDHARELCGASSPTSGKQLFDKWKPIETDRERRRVVNTLIDKVTEGNHGALKTVKAHIDSAEVVSKHLTDEMKERANSEILSWKSMLKDKTESF